MTYQKCEYKDTCKRYDKDSLCCTVYPLFNICLYKKRIDRIKEEARLKESKLETTE